MHNLGVSVRVTSDSRQGGRKYMEDVICIEFHKSNVNDTQSIDFVYLAVFDGHGGKEAALFAKEHLLKEIMKNKGFWSAEDQQVLKAIRDGFISTHKLMWGDVELWPRRLNGQPSTAGTTATVVFIRDGRLYIAHVGDSGVLIGVQEPDQLTPVPHCLTQDHKPNSPVERKRIEADGGEVVAKAGVHRVVWTRPKAGSHCGPIRRSTPLDRIPFLAVARSLGDLWSYNSTKNTFVVSPEPDLQVYHLKADKHKFLVLASDGLWNVMKPQQVTKLVDLLNEKSCCVGESATVLVRTALDWWSRLHLRADNTSAIVVYLDPQPDELPSPLPSPSPPCLRAAGNTTPAAADKPALRSPCGRRRQVASNITNSNERRVHTAVGRRSWPASVRRTQNKARGTKRKRSARSVDGIMSLHRTRHRAKRTCCM